jgi:hypothetical protein
MNKLIKILGSTGLLFSSLTFANDEQKTDEAQKNTDSAETVKQAIDPSDLTRVYSMVSGWVNSQNNVRATASWSGAWSENHSFMGFIEGYWGDEVDEDKWGTDLLKVRAQYFHVIDTDLSNAPKLGFSVDYIDNQGDNNLVAFGILGMVPPALTGKLQLFPNVAYMKGKAEGVDVDGYMLNLYGTYPISASGAFVQIWPEYIDVSGTGINSNSLTLSGLYAQPLDSLRTMWLNIRLDYATKETKLTSYPDRIKEDETVLTLGFKYYL